jgi:hypothetical protein
MLIDATPLLLDPGVLLLGESLGCPPRSPTRYRDTHAAIIPHTDYVPACARMAHERYLGRDS